MYITCRTIHALLYQHSNDSAVTATVTSAAAAAAAVAVAASACAWRAGGAAQGSR